MPAPGYKSLMLHKKMELMVKDLISQTYPYAGFTRAMSSIREDLRKGLIEDKMFDIEYPNPYEKGSGKETRDEDIAWLKFQMKRHAKAYSAKYGESVGTDLGPFSSIYITNLLLSKKEKMGVPVYLRNQDHQWLESLLAQYGPRYGSSSLSEFIPSIIRDLMTNPQSIGQAKTITVATS